MKLNLDSLVEEIHAHLKSSGLVVFPSIPQDPGAPGIYWDTERQPDYRSFVDAAVAAGVRLVTLSSREFHGVAVEAALEQLAASPMDRDERRAVETRLLEMQRYEGFTCQIQVSFDVAQRSYIFDLRTEWFEDLQELIDRIEDSFDDDEGEAPLGGYFSNN